MRLALCAAMISTFVLSVTPAASACETSDITIDQLKTRPEGSYVHIIGRILNKCSTATGVQIKIILMDGAGNILKVDDLWPASVKNIPAGSDFPFDLLQDNVLGFKKFQVRVIDVRKW